MIKYLTPQTECKCVTEYCVLVYQTLSLALHSAAVEMCSTGNVFIERNINLDVTRKLNKCINTLNFLYLFLGMYIVLS